MMLIAALKTAMAFNDLNAYRSKDSTLLLPVCT